MGAALRHLAWFAKEIVESHHNGTPHDDLVQGVITLLCKIYEIIDSESQFMSDAAKDLLPKNADILPVVRGPCNANTYHRRTILWSIC